MDDTQYCSGCKRNRFTSEFAPGPADAAPYHTCKDCRERRVTQRSKKLAKTKRPRATTLPHDVLGDEPGAESLNASSIRIEAIRTKPAYHPNMQETTSQKQRRRESDVRSKKMRARQRAVFKGDMVSPLTPLQHESSPDSFVCSICQQTHGMDHLVNPKGDDDPVCTICFRGSSSIEESDHPNRRICARCEGFRSLDLFETDNGTSRTCRPCRTARNAARHRVQPSQPTNVLPLPQSVIPTLELLEPAVSEEHWQYIEDFNEALGNVKVEECLWCKEMWFGLAVDEDGACKQCRGKKNRPIGVTGPFTVFSAANNADVGSVPPELPELTDIEEMLISRVHTHLQIRQVKGQQYKYAGHTVHFMKNMSRLYSKLPAHPDTLDIILLKPAFEGSDHNLRVNQEFERAFRVRKSRVLKWLYHLIENHPSYQDIEIDYDVMNLLPDDGSIHNMLEQRTITPVGEATGFNLGPMDLADHGEGIQEDGNHGQQFHAIVPNLRDETFEIDRLLEGFGIAPRSDAPPLEPSPLPPVSVPPFANTPVSEFDKKPLFSMAFPTLFPYGQGDINLNRAHKFTTEDWAKHLLRLKEQRFARHTRFRYVLFNTMMRQRAAKEASWAIKQDDEVTLDNLKELLEAGEEQQIVGLISRTGRKLRGTRPYWTQKRSDLEAMVRNLDCPNLFFTFSAADNQWADLHRHMPDYGEDFLTSPRRHIRATKNLVDNPHIAAQYLKLRFDLFFKHVLTKVFLVSHYWYRYEWQQRGSGHVHGFLWLETPAPLPTSVTEESRAMLAEYWEKYVTAVNPDSTLPALGVNPASLQFKDQVNTKQHLTECINRWQRHTKCRPTYCLKSKRGDDGAQHSYCRFHYPKTLRTNAEVNNEENKNHHKFMAKRNDELMVPYIPAITLGWMANTDMSPCTNVAAVIDYMGKYASKAESKSESYKEIFKNVTRQIPEESRRPLLSAATKMLNNIMVERDWSAQEIAHIGLGEDLVESSDEVHILDLRPDEHIALDIEDGQAVKRGKGWLQKYKERLNYHRANGLTEVQLSSVSLLEFCEWWDVGKRINKRTKEREEMVWKKTSTRAKKRVLNISPQYSSEGNKDEQEYEDFCRVKLMLHHPFVDPNTLKEAPDDLSVPTFRFAYEECQNNPDHHHTDDPYTLKTHGDKDNVSDHGDPDEQEPDPVQQAFTVFANRRGNHDGVQTNQALELGSRRKDREHDWCKSGHEIMAAHDLNFNQLNFMQDAKLHPVVVQQTDNSPNTLTHAQRVCFEYVIRQYNQELHSRSLTPVPQLLMHVDGSAGTGKSYLIEMISTYLYKMAQRFKNPNNIPNVEVFDPVIRGAPTGVAAFGIKGRTLHSLLFLPVRKIYEPLSSSALMKLQNGIWKGRRFLIIDEKSMLGLKQLHQIDQRLREIFPICGDKYFGGLNVLLMGDFSQLPPVGEKPLYNTIPGQSNELSNAQFLYSQFDKTVILTQIMRQHGEDDVSRRFRGCLQELRDGAVSEASYNLLMTRNVGQLSTLEQESFQTALRLYPLTKMVKDFNIRKLRERNLPVIRIVSEHNSPEAALGTEDDAEGLVTEILLSPGARLMLTNNILIEFGLVNGTMGTLLDIVWYPSADPLINMPAMLLFVPDKYPDGPSLYRREDGKAVLPIVPLKREWVHKRTRRSCRRTAFPVVVAYAITVHKSQGLTLDKIVLDLTIKDHSVGLTYVAISRARSLGGIMFDNPFTRARFETTDTETRQLRVADKDRRALQILQAP